MEGDRLSESCSSPVSSADSIQPPATLRTAVLHFRDECERRFDHLLSLLQRQEEEVELRQAAEARRQQELHQVSEERSVAKERLERLAAENARLNASLQRAAQQHEDRMAAVADRHRKALLARRAIKTWQRFVHHRRRPQQQRSQEQDDLEALREAYDDVRAQLDLLRLGAEAPTRSCAALPNTQTINIYPAPQISSQSQHVPQQPLHVPQQSQHIPQQPLHVPQQSQHIPQQPLHVPQRPLPSGYHQSSYYEPAYQRSYYQQSYAVPYYHHIPAPQYQPSAPQPAAQHPSGDQPQTAASHPPRLASPDSARQQRDLDCSQPRGSKANDRTPPSTSVPPTLTPGESQPAVTQQVGSRVRTSAPQSFNKTSAAQTQTFQDQTTRQYERGVNTDQLPATAPPSNRPDSQIQTETPSQSSSRSDQGRPLPGRAVEDQLDALRDRSRSHLQQLQMQRNLRRFNELREESGGDNSLRPKSMDAQRSRDANRSTSTDGRKLSTNDDEGDCLRAQHIHVCHCLGPKPPKENRPFVCPQCDPLRKTTFKHKPVKEIPSRGILRTKITR